MDYGAYCSELQEALLMEYDGTEYFGRAYGTDKRVELDKSFARKLKKEINKTIRKLDKATRLVSKAMHYNRNFIQQWLESFSDW